jgi:hypothetical protein
LTLYGVFALVGACYYVIEIRKVEKPEAHLWIASMLVLLMLPLALIAVLQMKEKKKGPPPVPEGYPMTEESLRSRIARANEILAVPHRAPFVGRIYEGFSITDEQIDYLALEDRFALCEHFRPLEKALKGAGLVRYGGPGKVVGGFRPCQGFPVPPGIEERHMEQSSHREYDEEYIYTCPVCNHTLIATCHGPGWPA